MKRSGMELGRMQCSRMKCRRMACGLMRGMLTAMLPTAVLACMTAGTARAGYDGNFQVVISDANRQAYGTLVGARHSPDNVQKLGCTIKADSVLCFATNAAGAYRTCVSTDPALMAVARSLNGDSYLWFVWDASGVCTSITVGLASQYTQ